jgi:hypothetical protein
MEERKLLIADDAPEIVKDAFTSRGVAPQTARVLTLLAELPGVDASRQPIASPGSPHRWPRHGD